ncbi:KAP family P-loop NTPase fold protein [Photobacterium toruni]|uniref:KAP family P-loop NTPase fold protein n=1 Tax=Photobacterium toruni TaxID=1935446 RepID=UPI0021109D24|nr:P-loop NTPase fold protein [Photobacterium toruni]
MSTNYTFIERDEFQRKEIAEKAIKLLQSDIEISPMVIDGHWGTGKTEFCHKLINLMAEDDTHHLLYIDAFKADHADEPLLTVLAEVIKLLPNENTRQRFIKKILPATRFGLKVIAKASAAHLLRQDTADMLNDFDKDIQKTADKVIDSSVESLLKDHVKADESLTSLQAALKEISDEKPIVIFIDELDRCRPNFSVHMLEVIKHTFDVDGVQFVLVTNTQQLKASINHCYGSSVDAQKYLDKFLKFTLSLPSELKNRREYHSLVSSEHYKNLVNNSEHLKYFELLTSSYYEPIHDLIKINKLSLREVESFIRNLNIYQVITNDKGFDSNIIYGYKIIRLISIFLFTIHPDMAYNIIKNTISVDELANFFGVNKTISTEKRFPDRLQVIFILLAQDSDISSEKILLPSSQEENQYWEDIFQRYFSGDYWRSSNESKRYLTIAKEAITHINLGN